MKPTIPFSVNNLEREKYDKQNLALALASLGLSGMACALGYHFEEINDLVMGIEGLNLIVQGILGLRLLKSFKESQKVLKEEEVGLNYPERGGSGIFYPLNLPKIEEA